MAERTTPRQPIDLAGVILGVAVTVNVLFFVMSHFYYADKSALEQAEINRARIAFAMLSNSVALAGYGAAYAPRLLGHGLAVLLGIASIAGAIAVYATGRSGVMGITLLTVGGLLPVLAWQSWRHARGAWAFLNAVVAVFAIVTFFGAPKVRNLLHVGLWYALIIPGLLTVCVIALAMTRDEYRER